MSKSGSQTHALTTDTPRKPRRWPRALALATITGALLIAPILFAVHYSRTRPPLDQAGTLGEAEPFIVMTTAGQPLGRYDLTGRISVVLISTKPTTEPETRRQAAVLARWMKSQLTYTGDIEGSPTRLITVGPDAGTWPEPWIAVADQPIPGTLMPVVWQASSESSPMVVVIDQRHQFRLLGALNDLVPPGSATPARGLRQLLSKLIVNHHLFEYLTQRTTMK